MKKNGRSTTQVRSSKRLGPSLCQPRRKSLDNNKYPVITVPNISSQKPVRESSSKPTTSPTEDKIVVNQIMVQTKPIGVESRVLMTNKACNVNPDHQDASQHTSNIFANEQYVNLLIEQYGFNPIDSDPVELFKPIEKVMACRVPKVENSSQCANPATVNTGTNGTVFEMMYNFETVEDLENCLRNGQLPGTARKNVEISEKPRLKVIAEKFTRFKKDHIELRRLEERIICVEYDVYSHDDVAGKEPIQVMRAYFCVKTGCQQCENAMLNAIPATIKGSLQLEEEAIKNNIEKEVEIIDEKLPENKPYLKDLKTVLKKRRAICAKKQKSTLDLISMYNMAHNEIPPRDHDWSNTNLLSKAELDEVKDLIMKKCESRVYNLSRKKMKKSNIAEESPFGVSEKTDSICYDLLRDFDINLK